MPLVDSKGRLFGLVNVVDVIVILFVLGLAVTSVMLAMGSSSQEEPESSPDEVEHYATLSYTVPLESDAKTLRTGDRLSTHGGDTLEVVDVHRSFNHTGSPHFTVRVVYLGNLTDDDGVVYGGDTMDIRVDRYRLLTTVLAVHQSERTLTTKTAPVVLMVDTSNSVEQYVHQGQEIRVDNHTVATVRSVTRVDDSSNGKVLLGMELRTWNRSGTAMFGGKGLRVGTPVTLVTDDVVLRGRVHKLNTSEPSTD